MKFTELWSILDLHCRRNQRNPQNYGLFLVYTGGEIGQIIAIFDTSEFKGNRIEQLVTACDIRITNEHYVTSSAIITAAENLKTEA